MTTTKRTVMALATLSMLLPSIASAQSGMMRRGGIREARMEARMEAREARAEVREDRAEAREDVREAAAEAREARQDAREETREAHRATRRERLVAVDARLRLRAAIRAGNRDAMRVAIAEIRAAHHAAREERGEAREARGEARQETNEAREQAREGRAEIRDARQQARRSRRDDAAAWREVRRQVRLARWAQIRARLPDQAVGPGGLQPAARDEMTRHARRVARLERIRDLAVEREDEDAMERVDVLLDLELARHAGAMGAAGIEIEAEEVEVELAVNVAADTAAPAVEENQ